MAEILNGEKSVVSGTTAHQDALHTVLDGYNFGIQNNPHARVGPSLNMLSK